MMKILHVVIRTLFVTILLAIFVPVSDAANIEHSPLNPSLSQEESPCEIIVAIQKLRLPTNLMDSRTDNTLELKVIIRAVDYTENRAQEDAEIFNLSYEKNVAPAPEDERKLVDFGSDLQFTVDRSRFLGDELWIYIDVWEVDAAPVIIPGAEDTLRNVPYIGGLLSGIVGGLSDQVRGTNNNDLEAERILTLKYAEQADGTNLENLDPESKLDIYFKYSRTASCLTRGQ